MTSSEWIEIAKALAWPFLGLVALIYIWRSDAINNLIKISEAVKDLKERLADLVKAEEKMRYSIEEVKNLTVTVGDIADQFASIKADVETIRDKVDQKPESDGFTNPAVAGAKDVSALYSEINQAWQNLTDILQNRFGWFDLRKTGSEAYRFAHGNRKGAKLEYDQAEEVARLHSSIKSYRRRQSSISDWLTPEIRDEFVNACSDMSDQIRAIIEQS